jgi:mannose-6-phosphate isomerase-like protein (cupin superfamily)
VTPTWRADATKSSGEFEGAEHGSPVSCIIVDMEPGDGPRLHHHPYPETFIVLGGSARFEVAGEPVFASEGDVVVAPADTPHRFEVLGPDNLRMVTVHAAPRMDTTWHE